MNLSHRLRLALASSVATGVVLAVLFSSVAFFARRDVLSDKRAELVAIMRGFTPPGDPSFDLAEFHSAHPDLSAAVYERDGRQVGSAGRVPPRHFLGFREAGERLAFGTTFKGQDVSISLSLRETDRGLILLSEALVVLWFPLTLLVGGITWGAAQSVFRPLERLSAQALATSGRDLSERLGTSDRAEFGAFARNLNHMLDRIEETVRRGERFSTDAAHELRTPLAILRTRLETALIQSRSPEEYETTIRRSIGEIERLTSITESLLRSARGTTEKASPIDLHPLVEEAVGRWRERFEARSVRLETRSEAIEVIMLPDEARIVLDNLLDNALRYAPPDSKVTVSLAVTGREARLMVSDEGTGIPATLGEKVFDRFVRADDSRNRASGGAGIGLSVCRQIVTERGGRMALGKRPEGGAEVGCFLPSHDRGTCSK